MHILLDAIKKQVFDFIKIHKIDAVGFVPPTIKRELQLMHFIQNGLELTLPIVQIQKISGLIAVPQKSLNKIDERINNANKTFTIPELNSYNKVLLIDDAVGSGATLNQIARKIKEKRIAKHIDAIALVGSFKGFDVITDV
jgi:predicted amidophosphoribosyltransferase